MVKIAPSILAADFSRLGKEVARCDSGGADYVHVDVMDGAFVPNLTMGPPVIAAIRSASRLPFDVHLMVQHPRRSAEDYVRAGANLLTIHLEAEEEVPETLREIRDLGVKPGIAIKPSTTFEAVKPYLDQVDLLLIMTVEPGFGGQQFLMEVLPKIEEARAFLEESDLDIELEVDGGIDDVTAGYAAKAGADVFVAGTAVYAGRVKERVARLRERAQRAAR